MQFYFQALCRSFHGIALQASKVPEYHLAIIIIIIIHKNPWRYSPEQPRPTEVVASIWQYRGPCCQQSAYPSTLICFLNRISVLFIQVATQLSSRGWVGPVQDPILPEKFVGQPGIEPGTSWMAVRRANHYTKQAVTSNIHRPTQKYYSKAHWDLKY